MKTLKNSYITGVGSVSIQTQSKGFVWEQMNQIRQGINKANPPSYKEMLPANAIRRMSTGVKMGIYAAKDALKEGGIENPDAIFTGTGLGCLIDSEKFLETLLDNDENYLNPTAFIQSTHNTVGGQIALHLGCKGYNFTYVHQNSSFESALLDAFLQNQTGEANQALVGGVDEVGPTTVKHLQYAEKLNTEDIRFEKGVDLAEGATFFTLSNSCNSSAYAEIVDVWVSNTWQSNTLETFLKDHKISESHIKALFLGSCELPVDQHYFSNIAVQFPNAEKISYKKYVGHHHTASSFGLLLAAEYLKAQPRDEQNNSTYVLLYNQFMGKDHSLILLKNVE